MSKEYLEALECLEDMAKYRIEYSDYSMPIKDISEYNTIKQALLKAQEQEKVLKILFEKNVDILELRILIEHHNDKDVLNLYNSERGKELQLTQEDLDLLKRYCNEI